MSSEQRENDLRIAVLEWQKKYGIHDGDPLLAALELFQIHLDGFTSAMPGGSNFSFFEEFRDSVESLDRQSKSFSKHAAELSKSLITVPSIKHQLRSYHATAFVLVALFALTAGILIGKFIL